MGDPSVGFAFDANAPFGQARLISSRVGDHGRCRCHRGRRRVARLGRDEPIAVAAVVDEYCTDCHNDTDWDGGIAFDLRGESVQVRSQKPDGREAAVWEKAARKVRAGMMPPARARRPDTASLARFVRGIESRLDAQAAKRPNFGSVPLSRLNRAEYRSAVRDVLSFDASRVVDRLPVDEAVGGFDNIGDGLGVSPTLIEAYVAAALVIAREAVGDRSATATQVRYEAPAGLRQDAHVDGLPLGTRGGMAFTHVFPLDASYDFRVAAIGPGPLAGQTLCDAPAITVALDGRMIAAADPKQFRMTVPAGPHELAVALHDSSRCAGVNEFYDSYSVAGGVRHVEILGPFDATGPGDTPSRRRIFECYPETASEEASCARRILTTVATRAYRRPLAAESPEIESLFEFYSHGREAAGFEGGVEHALARILMSPQFIFQLEGEPVDLPVGEPYRLTDLEIATRLSFFLWSSIPDDELLSIAAKGELSHAGVLEAQVERMLDDPRASCVDRQLRGPVAESARAA